MLTQYGTIPLFFLPIHSGFHVFPFRLITVERFGMTDQKITAANGRVVHPVDEFMLRWRVEVNHNIPTPGTVELLLERKRFVHQVELSERNLFFDLFVCRIAVRCLFEVFVKKCRRHPLHSVLRIGSTYRLAQCLLGDIGCKKPTVPIFVVGTEEFHKRHDQRVRFLASRCCRTPNPKIVVLLVLVCLDHPRQNVALEKIEVVRLTKEERVIGRNLIRQFANELVGFVISDHVIVLFECLALIFFEQFLKPTNNEAFFLVGEGDSEAVVHQIADRVEFRIGDLHHFCGYNGGVGHGTFDFVTRLRRYYTTLLMGCNYVVGRVKSKIARIDTAFAEFRGF